MQELRPIGTEFDHCFTPDTCSTKTVFVICRYRVTDHAWVRSCGTRHQAETVEVAGAVGSTATAYELDAEPSKERVG